MKRIKYFIIIILFSANFANSQSAIDSMIKLVDTTWANVIDTNKINTLNDLAWKIKISDSENAVKYSYQAIELSIKLKFIKGKALAYKNLGGIYYLQSDFYNAFENYTKSLELYTQIGDKESKAKVIRNIGSVYDGQGNYDSALVYFLKSLEMRKKLGDLKGEASLYNAIGLVYSKQGVDKYDKSLEYYEKALNICDSINDIDGIASSYLRIGTIHHRKKEPDYKLALDYFVKYNEIVESNGSLKSIAESYDALGLIYTDLEGFKNAEYYLFKALEIWKEMDSQYGIASTYNNLGAFYVKQNKYNEAIKYYEKTFELSKKNSLAPLEQKASLKLKQLHELLGNYKVALEYFNRSVELSDSMQLGEISEKIAQIELRRDFDKKIKEKELVEVQNKAKMRQQRIVIVSFIFGLILLVGFFIVIIRSYKLLKNKNNKIQEQNAILLQQKEEIETQRDEIEQQRDIVVEQRDKISIQKRHITDSIQYAKHIQNAILPPEETIKLILSDILLFYKPRDIVSGDFYWIEEKEEKKLICCADCTGHGVPGAFMSMLGISFLNEILNKFHAKDLKANLILNILRDNVKKSLHQTDTNSGSKDGMDLALCIIDNQEKILQYAGANNPLIFIRNNEIEQINPDKMPIGIYLKEKESFTNNEIEIKKDDLFYMFSDGFPDQFGGEFGKKYMIKNFRNLIFGISQKTFAEQEQIFENELSNWRNPKNNTKFEQLDDITIIGFRI